MSDFQKQVIKLLVITVILFTLGYLMAFSLHGYAVEGLKSDDTKTSLRVTTNPAVTQVNQNAIQNSPNVVQPGQVTNFLGVKQ